MGACGVLDLIFTARGVRVCVCVSSEISDPSRHFDRLIFIVLFYLLLLLLLLMMMMMMIMMNEREREQSGTRRFEFL